jgi:lipid II:glycine glycyltransferase (peptidoglycan interpeptide bridge formation enzyme)
MQGEIAYYHLGAFSEVGYEERAAFALFWSAIHHFRDLGLKWLHLGGREGAQKSEEETAGLSAFKSGWSTGVLPAYFCGRIFMRKSYEQITNAFNASQSTYFPAYRTGEFL